MDSVQENKIPNLDAALADQRKLNGAKPVQHIPARVPRAKPGSELTCMLGKIAANQDKIVAHNMSDTKLDQALKIFSAKYSDDQTWAGHLSEGKSRGSGVRLHCLLFPIVSQFFLKC